MIFTTDAVVIREKHTGEADRILTLLSRDRGVFDAFAKGARRPKNKLHGVTQLFSYASFTFFEGKSISINEGQQKHIFFELREDIEKLALAQYFCEIASVVVPPNQPSDEFLRLFLNTIHFLCKGTQSPSMIKSIFELRFISSAGYMPDLVGCSECGCFESSDFYFDIQNAALTCGECIKGFDVHLYEHIGTSVLAAMRHILYSEMSDLFRFSLSGDSLSVLSSLTEKFFKSNIPLEFKTLKFYKSIL